MLFPPTLGLPRYCSVIPGGGVLQSKKLSSYGAIYYAVCRLQASLSRQRIIKKPHLYAALVFLLCDSVGIRTQDPQLRRLLLYPTELPNPFEECKDSTIFYFFKDLAINSIIKTIEKPIATNNNDKPS